MKVLLLSISILFIAQSAAQERWNLTFRPSLNISTRAVLNHTMRLGNGADFSLSYLVNPNTKVYSGFTYNHFDRKDDIQDENFELKQTGAIAGGFYSFRIFKKQKSSYYIRAGLTYTSISFSSLNPVYDFNVRWSLGTQLGIGLQFEPAQGWFLKPEMRYSSSSHPNHQNRPGDTINLEYISITMGIMRRF